MNPLTALLFLKLLVQIAVLAFFLYLIIAVATMDPGPLV